MMSTQLFARKTLAKQIRCFSQDFSARPSYNGHWMPFTDHDRFKKKPKLFSRAKGMYLYDENNREILDGCAGLWCVNAGHAHPRVVEAIQKQAGVLDYAPAFNCGHSNSTKFAQRILDLFPADKKMTEVFFTVCGSSAVDTSLKMALQYYRARGEAQRVRFIGRERAYHGVNFGGVSVGGILANRKAFSSQKLPFVDHLSHTQSLKDMAFSRGLPKWGEHLADELEKLVTFHDPSTIAAVIIEPVAGATGVLPPPEGYLKKIRDICTKHGILLIFDEVITGFGRLGAPFGSLKLNVTPDIITCAKGLTNAAVPAGAVITQSHIFETIHKAAHKLPEMQVEFFHGYTYSAHPLAMAAGMAALDAYQQEKIFENADNMAKYWEDGLHSLKGLPNVVDIRNCGLLGAVEMSSIPGAPVKRSMDVYDRLFEKGVFCRVSGPALAFSPPLILEKKHVDFLVDRVASAIKESHEQLK